MPSPAAAGGTERTTMQLRRRRPKTTTELLMEQVAELAERVSLLGGQAVVAIAPRIEDARDAAIIVYQEARTRVRDEYVPKVRDEYVPKVRDEYVRRCVTRSVSASART
jgi:hypothetical protein